jgi:hypothetical protein
MKLEAGVFKRSVRYPDDFPFKIRCEIFRLHETEAKEWKAWNKAKMDFRRLEQEKVIADAEAEKDASGYC